MAAPRSLLLSCVSLIWIALPAPYAVAQNHAPPSPLQDQVQAIAAHHHGEVALFAENLKTHETVSITPDLTVQTASVIKLAILYEALEQIRNGQAHFEDPLTLAAANQVPGSGVLSMFDTPLNLTFKDALTMMIVMSDNTATNLVIDHLGLKKIDAEIARLGLTNTYLYKKVFLPAPPGTVMPADQARFGLGKTTPREMAELMTKIAQCDLGNASEPAKPSDQELCKVALKMLHQQFYRNAIPRYLDGMPGATPDSIANKTGSLDAVRNDVAAVSTKTGMVVIAAFTFNNQDHSWGVEQEGELTIANLARAIIQSWSPLGLAPWPDSSAAK